MGPRPTLTRDPAGSSAPIRVPVLSRQFPVLAVFHSASP